jgi:hypothetical protein
MSSIHTLGKITRVPGFFTKENVSTISKLITETIKQNFSSEQSKYKMVVVPDPHIVRMMQQIQEEYIEDISKMNQRVVMTIVRMFMDDTRKQEQANYWASNYWNAWNYQELGIKQFDTPNLKGKKVGKNTDLSAFSFRFTY